MGAAFFYHLTRHPVDVTVSMLLGKALGAGWRVAVRGTDLGRLYWLDEKLWAGQEADFLPHGLAGGTYDMDQLRCLRLRITRSVLCASMVQISLLMKLLS